MQAMVDKKKAKKQGGYVLVEVLVTMLIVSIALTTILGGYSLLGNAAAKGWPRSLELIQEKNEVEKKVRFEQEP